MRVVFVIVCAILAGCSTTEWDKMRANPREYFNLLSPTIVTDARIDGQRVSLKRGQALVVRLDEDPASGQRWTMRPPDSNVVIAPVQHDYTNKPGADAAKPDAPGEAVFRLRGVSPGTQAVALDYRRPSDGSVAKTVRFDVVVDDVQR